MNAATVSRLAQQIAEATAVETPNRALACQLGTAGAVATVPNAAYILHRR